MFKFEEYLNSGHKILILFGPQSLEKYQGIIIDKVYRETKGYLDKQLFKLAEHIPLISKRQWYGKWADTPKGYDLIIIVNGIRGRDVAELLRENNPAARIIIYYETTIDITDRKAPHFYQGLGIEFWSFDKGDCQIWQAKYNKYFHSYYPGDLQTILKEHTYCDMVSTGTDVFFCGYDKNRLTELVALKKQLDIIGLKTNFVIVRTPHKYYSPQDKENSCAEFMPYKDIMHNIRKSWAILDYVIQGQYGITLRPMESIFFKRKLITNNPEVKEYDFYRKENVFILGEDSLDKLKDFLSTPYKEIPEEIIKNYLPEAWLDRFFDE